MDSKWPVVPNDDPHPHRSPPNGRPAVWCRGDDRVIVSCVYIRRQFEKCPPRIALFFRRAVNQPDRESRFWPSTMEFEAGSWRTRPGRSRQHERGVNKRRQRIRSQNVGPQAQPWGLSTVLNGDKIQPENSPQATEAQEGVGYTALRAGGGRQQNRRRNSGRRNGGSIRP